MESRRAILWFRNDLRLHDNEALLEAMSSSSDVYPVYVFDERVFKGQLSYGIRKTDKFRAQFILESVIELRSSLQAIGSDLIIRLGHPEIEIFNLAKELKTHWVFCNRERTQEELSVQDKLEESLWEIGQEVRYSRGKMLYYTADLPFPITHTPDIFTQFRKEVEKIVPVRKIISRPVSMPHFEEDVDLGTMPSLGDWDFNKEEAALASSTIYRGGESHGLNRLQHYIWDSGAVATYKETRNDLKGLDYSSKFSLYLAHGCVSPKMIYHELKAFEKEKVSNDSTYHLFFELLWRDFFRLMGKKHGNNIFLKGGIKEKVREDLTDDMTLFRIWSEGRTGMPLVDAAMRELNATGYMSNRARQNVASFLVNDLHVNWQIGAEYFESLLIDYDPCSNWGNWNYVAGVGTDPREGRYFNIITQAKKYDANGAFVKQWIPELSGVPPEKIHQTYALSEEDQKSFRCVLQKDYPDLCIKKEGYL